MCCEDGNAYAWGEGKHGSLGLGTLQDTFKPEKIKLSVEAKIVKIDCGLEHSVMLDTGGRMFVSGSNEKG